MPKIFEYLGFTFLFYANDHLPVHVHVQFGEFESKIIFAYEEGKLKSLVYKNVKRKIAIPSDKQKEVNKFLKKYHSRVVEKWNDFFVYNKTVKCEVINKKVK